ncbi:MAG: sodium-dependent transporter [Bacteroidales bacterium]|nr:sodium-dependent transporter [Bacteroidales bacterium]MDD3330927.1 sodium-dependent transporter [Bacteroidales bacterium]MDD3691720.1 sodium-dependent transporter [Bacteroidales bacterium]MDD4045172.1 sodium-dependent transporter [Bacteroidales bacterium]
MNQPKETWGSRLGLVLAMAGNAVGLGNFLRFPIQAVQNGGGAFILPYLLSFILLGIPLLFVEWSTGRFGGVAGFNSPPYILQSIDKRKIWKYIGAVGIFSNIAIAAYYCYIESWTMSYVYHSFIGTFKGLSETQVSQFFDNYLDVRYSTTGIPFEAIVFYIFCLGLNVWILSRGLQKGIEKVAKICMPLLILFGIFLMIKAFTLKAGQDGAVYDGLVGFNFLWTPQFDSLANPKVWLAAAGQIFFTLSLGMGCIQCYASYLKKNDDLVVNSLTTGFTNEFCEIVIGSSIIIPISIGYFGIDKVIELASFGGFGLGFRSLPFLFSQWGDVMGLLAGVAFFGLLFFSGITSSLAMGSPIVAFLKDGFNWGRKKSSLAFGFIILLFGLPTVLFFSKGVFDQYDYWAGTVSLVVFAMLEIILFSWVLGVDKGWKLIHQGADMQLPRFFKFVLKYITPTLLILIFLSSLLKPKNDDWSQVSFKGWELDNASIIGELLHQGIGPNHTWFSDAFFAENDGKVDSIYTSNNRNYLRVTGKASKSYEYQSSHNITVALGDDIKTGDTLFKGNIINDVFYIDVSRLSLVFLLLFFAVMIKIGYSNIKKNNVNVFTTDDKQF